MSSYSSPVPQSSAPKSLDWHRVIVMGQWVLVGLFLVQGFRSSGRPFDWLLLASIIPGLRLAFDASYRTWCRMRIYQLYQSFSLPDACALDRCWAAFCLVVVPSLVFFSSTQRTRGTGDTWAVLPTASALVLEGSWDLERLSAKAPKSYGGGATGRLPYSVVRTESGVYSRYPSGMVPFAVPVTATARLLGADLERPKTWTRLEKWTAAWLAACSCGLFFLIALQFVEPLAAGMTTLLLGTGSVFFSTCSQAMWQHGGMIFWMLLILYVEMVRDGRPGWRGTLLQGLAAGMMVACRLSAGLFLLPFGLWVLFRDWKRGLLVGVLGGLTYLPWVGLHLSMYGQPFGPSVGQLGDGQWMANPWGAFLGLLFSPGRGLLVYQPWALLALLALVPAWRMGSTESTGLRGWRLFCVVTVFVHIGLVSGWNIWWGGHCWGSRLLAETVPLLGLLCLQPVARLLKSRVGVAILASLLIVSLFVHASGMFREVAWEYDVQLSSHPEMVWSWARAPFFSPSH